jgi:hypothetical protein
MSGGRKGAVLWAFFGGDGPFIVEAAPAVFRLALGRDPAVRILAETERMQGAVRHIVSTMEEKSMALSATSALNSPAFAGEMAITGKQVAKQEIWNSKFLIWGSQVQILSGSPMISVC